MHQGIDTVARISATQAKRLKEEGVSFVGRYLAPGKDLTPEEANILREAGLAILLCWETTSNRIRGGAKAGAADGEAAMRAAVQLGVPAGTVIYFAADYDVPASDYASVEAYLRQAKFNCEPYTVGLYGPERVVAEMSRRNACDFYWQCVAWSNQFLPVANVRQYAWQGDPRAKEMAVKCGILAVDLDSAESLNGMWLPPAQEKPWYYDAMEWAEEIGLMKDGRPNDYVTRAEDATMFQRYDEHVQKMIVEAIKAMQPEDDKRFGGLTSD